MKNSYKLGLAAVAASVALVGCGGSSDTSADIGTSFYIDNAVEGVNYKCGTQEGTTNADGKFTFDIGSGCTFHLGTIFLRDVNVDELVDGTEMYETNKVLSAQMLGMDTDGDPSNGITINADIVVALEEAGIVKLPDTDTAVADLAEVQTLIEDNGGTYVTLEEAQAHLDETMTTALTGLLAGKTFYNVGSDSTGDTWIDKIVVNTDATSIAAASLVDSTDTATFDMVIKADTIALSNADENFELIFIQEATDKLVFHGLDANGSVVEEDLMFFDQAAAQAYYDSLQPTETATDTTTSAGTPSVEPTLRELLAGQTLYNETYYQAWEFNADVTSIYWYDVDYITLGSTNSGTYDIVLSGNTITSGNEEVLAEISDKYITLTWPNGTKENLWYNLAEMEAANPELAQY